MHTLHTEKGTKTSRCRQRERKTHTWANTEVRGRDTAVLVSAWLKQPRRPQVNCVVQSTREPHGAARYLPGTRSHLEAVFSRPAGESRGAGRNQGCKGLTLCLRGRPAGERNLNLFRFASVGAALRHFRQRPPQRLPASNFRPLS